MILPKLLRRIFSGYPLKDWGVGSVSVGLDGVFADNALTLLASRMLRLKLGEIVHILVNDDEQVVFRFV